MQIGVGGLNFSGNDSGGNASSSAGNLVLSIPTTYSEFNGTAGHTFFQKIPGRAINGLSKKWTFAFNVLIAGVMTIDKIVVARTLIDDLNVLDFTPVTIGANPAPFNLNVGRYQIDPISVQLDGDHDYYVMFYFDPSTVNVNIGNDGATNPFFANWNVGGNNATATQQMCMCLFLNYPGDGTAVTPVPLSSGGTQAVGPHNIIESVQSA